MSASITNNFFDGFPNGIYLIVAGTFRNLGYLATSAAKQRLKFTLVLFDNSCDRSAVSFGIVVLVVGHSSRIPV
jgi:hypothetical protein